MAKLVWDKTGERLYETGTSNGVLYVMDNVTSNYKTGVAWNGLTGVSQNPDGAEASAKYADNIKYLNLISEETFKATVTAFTYPDEFAACDGSGIPVEGVNIGQQSHNQFGLTYVTKKGNDTLGSDYGMILHFVYGATAAPSKRDYQTINDSPDAIEFSWDLNTAPVTVSGYKPTSHVTVDSTVVSVEAWKALTEAAWGSDSNATESNAKMLMPDEIVSIISSHNSNNTTPGGTPAGTPAG